jgi:hypothetical protein
MVFLPNRRDGINSISSYISRGIRSYFSAHKIFPTNRKELELIVFSLETFGVDRFSDISTQLEGLESGRYNHIACEDGRAGVKGTLA